MSYSESLLYGIERVFDENFCARGKKGAYVYKIPCQKCGKIFTKQVYRSDLHNVCDLCKIEVTKKLKLLPKEIEEIETKEEKRFKKAIFEIEKQVKNILDYDRSIEIARKKQFCYGSIPEAMVAIELIKLGYKIIPQQKIGKYKVDFVIPKEKIIIEVDGCVFHSTTNDEREATIQLMIGIDWKIIHIPAEKIRKNITRLKTIIDSFYT